MLTPLALLNVSVEVLDGARLSIVPAPLSMPVIGLKPCRSSRPPLLMVKKPVLGKAALLPTCRVPAVIVVPPL